MLYNASNANANHWPVQLARTVCIAACAAEPRGARSRSSPATSTSSSHTPSAATSTRNANGPHRRRVAHPPVPSLASGGLDADLRWRLNRASSSRHQSHCQSIRVQAHTPTSTPITYGHLIRPILPPPPSTRSGLHPRSGARNHLRQRVEPTESVAAAFRHLVQLPGVVLPRHVVWRQCSNGTCKLVDLRTKPVDRGLRRTVIIHDRLIQRLRELARLPVKGIDRRRAVESPALPSAALPRRSWPEPRRSCRSRCRERRRVALRYRSSDHRGRSLRS